MLGCCPSLSCCQGRAFFSPRQRVQKGRTSGTMREEHRIHPHAVCSHIGTPHKPERGSEDDRASDILDKPIKKIERQRRGGAGDEGRASNTQTRCWGTHTGSRGETISRVRPRSL